MILTRHMIAGTLPPEDRGGSGDPGAEADPSISGVLDGLPRRVCRVHHQVLRVRQGTADGELFPPAIIL